MDTRASLILAEFSATGLLTALEGEDAPVEPHGDVQS